MRYRVSKIDILNGFMAKTIRLIYPQWQGAEITRWIPEVKRPEEAARGYYLGAQILNMLAPASKEQSTFVVPITLDGTERLVTEGVLDREILIRQTQAALDILAVENPDRIVTLGGECSVSVAPFTYLARKYVDDVVMIWIDAHPDITLPGDVYAGYHAMAVTACMGLGDAGLIGLLPASIPANRILYVGLRDWEREEIKVRHHAYGIDYLAPSAVAENVDALRAWLRKCGARKALVHFDLDVLDPAEIVAAVGVVPDGMKMEAVARLINAVAEEKDLVALTIAEPMPRTAIRLRELLAHLPLLNK